VKGRISQQLGAGEGKGRARAVRDLDRPGGDQVVPRVLNLDDVARRVRERPGRHGASASAD